MISATNVVVKVPIKSANAPKLGGLSPAGFGIQRGLVKKCHQSSFGTIGAASLKMKRKIATIAMMLLQPQSRISHSMGFSSKSTKRNFFLAALDGGLVVIGAMAQSLLSQQSSALRPKGSIGCNPGLVQSVRRRSKCITCGR